MLKSLILKQDFLARAKPPCRAAGAATGHSYYCLEKTQRENHVSDFMQPASKNARSVFVSLRSLNGAEAL
jgi:hypothetical protein